MVLFITDFQSSTVGNVEADVQLQSAAIPIARASVFNTSPIAAIFETQPMVIGGNNLNVVIGTTVGTNEPVDFFVGGYLQALGF